MRSVYEKRQDTVYMHCIQIDKFRYVGKFLANFAALRAQANLKSELIESTSTPKSLGGITKAPLLEVVINSATPNTVINCCQ